MQSHLTNTAMIVNTSMTRWTARKTDKAASADVAEDKGAKHGAVRLTKDLIPRARIVKINAVYEDVRRFVDSLTVPWDDSGRRLIPAQLVMKLEHGLRGRERAFWDAVAELQSAYADLRDSAYEELGELFDEADYPPASAIPSRFAFSWEFTPVPAEGDIRVDLPESFREELEARVTHGTQSRLQAAERAVFEKIHGTVSRLHRVVLADKPRVYASLVTDLQNLADVLPDLNLTDNPRLTKMSDDLNDMLRGVTLERLRDDEMLREDLTEPTQTIVDQLKGMF
jgi:hypothetical protein